MAEILVKYNNVQLYPTPLVNRSMQMVDLGNGRWGNVESIELKGFLTGIATTGDYTRITSVFTGNFGSLVVTDGTSNLYSWSNVVVEEIKFDSSKWPINGFTPYNVSLKSFNIPSGVIDATNEYSFTQNEDGTVNVNHKISARGVKTAAGALDNAIAFVGLFTGKNPYTNCAPVFIPNGSGVLMSISDSIDRLTQTYSVNEVYKFVTGSTNPYVETSTVSVDESPNRDYVGIDFNAKFQASPVNGNLSQLQSQVSAIDFSQRLAAFGIDTTNLYKENISISQDSGANTVEVRIGYVSGLNNDSGGYFDWNVSVEENLINGRNLWKIEGEFICRGPISFRRQQIENFKTTTIADNGSLEGFLLNRMMLSPLYANSPYAGLIDPIPKSFTIAENTGLATFKLAASYLGVENPYGLIEPKYSVSFDLSKWNYELIPAANIEGHYVVQDLQMKSRPKITFSLSAGHVGDTASAIGNLGSVFYNLSGAYVGNNPFLLQETITTGYNDISIERVVSPDSIIDESAMVAHKVHGSFAQPITRPKGYQFGY